VEHYARALALYREARFTDAAHVLETALAADPGDGPCRVILARCQRYTAHPPAMPFEGVTSLEK
jgi:adenylate cyclase